MLYGTGMFNTRFAAEDVFLPPKIADKWGVFLLMVEDDYGEDRIPIGIYSALSDCYSAFSGCEDVSHGTVYEKDGTALKAITNYGGRYSTRKNEPIIKWGWR